MSRALEVETAPASGRDSRVQAPFGRRRCVVTANEGAGVYRLVEADDPGGPAPLPGQFYMLAAEEEWGGSIGRPYLARAFSVCRVRDSRLAFLVDAIGPGTDRLAALERGELLGIVGPLGAGFALPEANGRPLLVGGGIGIAPLVIWSEALAADGLEPRSLLGFRSAAYAGAADLLRGEVRLATDDGSAGQRGFVTELLERELEDDPGATVYACGPPAMLEAVRAICARRSVPAQLALEAPMACGFGACMGCVVKTTTGYRRLCVDGPVVRAADLEEGWE
jgi:dihydroorotate dehydrogenase electron transfer subunit